MTIDSGPHIAGTGSGRKSSMPLCRKDSQRPPGCAFLHSTQDSLPISRRNGPGETQLSMAGSGASTTATTLATTSRRPKRLAG